ncbi:hypothetical protein FA15DRAFT_356612 [Coprinopsis marcescibilis]|uniref:Uncharacterized protein n=1 Tax=Coprinopsis marcescibilis TaxID=230819 RepID=A0A5C3KXL3_COPMA|nr:hypothetical protein FA15DRAFT_356612 [Coprinopsis marcescibilis]
MARAGLGWALILTVVSTFKWVRRSRDSSRVNPNYDLHQPRTAPQTQETRSLCI